jgi:hypothetical protein
MRSATTAKIVPAIVLAISVFFMVFWYTSSRRVGEIPERVPTQDDAASTTDQRGPSGPSANSPSQTATAGTPAAQAGTTAASGAATPNAAEPPAVPGSWPSFRGANLDAICTETVPLSAKWAPGEPKI